MTQRALPALALGFLYAFSAAPEEQDAWTALKSAWASEHLKLADRMLQAGCLGFADTQAGLAGQLAGPGDEGVAAYTEKRRQAKLPDKGWIEADWTAYEARRLILHRKEAKEASALLGRGGMPEAVAKEVEGWALRLDPDQPDIRKRRGEEKVSGLGWLPAETAACLKRGLLRFKGSWEKPAPGKYTSWEEAYEIPSEHFVVKTVLSREKALETASDLEALYRIWEELFEGIGPLEGGGVVWSLKTLADYQACAAVEAPSCAALFRNPKVLAFACSGKAFLREDRGNEPKPFRCTLFHEASHLLHYGIAGFSGKEIGHWCVEGTAMLMEALPASRSLDWNASAPMKGNPRAQDRQAFGLGGAGALPGMGAGAFMAEGQKHYFQSYFLVHFLMYGQGGAHRQALLRHLLILLKGEDLPYETGFPDLTRAELEALAKAHAARTVK